MERGFWLDEGQWRGRRRSRGEDKSARRQSCTHADPGPPSLGGRVYCRSWVFFGKYQLPGNLGNLGEFKYDQHQSSVCGLRRMNNVRQWSALLLCVAAIADWSAAAADDVSAEPPASGIKTRPLVDKAHPLIVYENEYPDESKLRGEQGSCAVRVQVGSDGVIRSEQLVVSTGFTRLDVACLDAFSGARMFPATVDGKPVATWIILPITWSISRGNNSAAKVKKLTDDQLEVPVIEEDYDLKVGPDFFPAEAREMHQEGECAVRALVRDRGAPSAVKLMMSTGSSSLDEACVAAIQTAQFVPGHSKEGPPINVVDIYMSWRLTSGAQRKRARARCARGEGTPCP